MFREGPSVADAIRAARISFALPLNSRPVALAREHALMHPIGIYSFARDAYRPVPSARPIRFMGFARFN